MPWVPLQSGKKGKNHFDLLVFIFQCIAALVSDVSRRFSCLKLRLANSLTNISSFCFFLIKTIASFIL